MNPDPEIPSSDQADAEVQSTPAGLTQELAEKIDETGAEVAPEAD